MEISDNHNNENNENDPPLLTPTGTVIIRSPFDVLKQQITDAMKLVGLYKPCRYGLFYDSGNEILEGKDNFILNFYSADIRVSLNLGIEEDDDDEVIIIPLISIVPLVANTPHLRRNLAFNRSLGRVNDTEHNCLIAIRHLNSSPFNWDDSETPDPPEHMFISFRNADIYWSMLSFFLTKTFKLDIRCDPYSKMYYSWFKDMYLNDYRLASFGNETCYLIPRTWTPNLHANYPYEFREKIRELAACINAEPKETEQILPIHFPKDIFLLLTKELAELEEEDF